MSTYVIGDIQGCFGSLQSLLDSFPFDFDRDRLWLVGDLVNRGPDSLATLRFVRDLGERAVCVLGNHDLHLLSVAAGCSKLRDDDTLDEVLQARDRDELIDWLRHRPMLHLAIAHIRTLAEQLSEHYGPDCPVAVVANASRPDEVVLRGRLDTIAEQVESAGVRRTAVILVGRALTADAFADSYLYSPGRDRSAKLATG